VQAKILDWAYVLLVLAISVLALIGVLLFAWHIEDATPWADMKAADWGVWVGALGTVAALFGTIVLATTETRRRHSDNLSAARLHSISMRLRLGHAHEMLRKIAENLSKATEDDSPQNLFALSLVNFRQIDRWNVVDLLPLTPLPKQTAANLAQAADELRVVERVLVQLSERYAGLSVVNRMRLVRGLHPNMTKTSHLIKEALVEVTRAVEDLGIPIHR